MKTLAIETTDQSGSIALLEGGRLVSENRLSPQQRSAQSLAPAMRDALASAGWRPAEIRMVAVAIGPGSFTGLRVGVTTAKTFAYAVGCDLIGVPTLEVVAAQVAAERQASATMPTAFGPQHLVAVLDAGRQQVFSARFRLLSSGDLQCVEPTALVDDAVWLAGLEGGAREGEIISGPGLKKFIDRLPANATLAPAESWAPRALTVGRLALMRHGAGQRDDPWKLVPLYHRPSAAEEKLGRGKP